MVRADNAVKITIIHLARVFLAGQIYPLRTTRECAAVDSVENRFTDRSRTAYGRTNRFEMLR